MAEKQSLKVLSFVILSLLGLIVILFLLYISYNDGFIPLMGQIKTITG